MDPTLLSSDSEEPSDIELWHALRQGDIQALGQLYDRHGGLVYGTAVALLDQQEAEDLTQDIFLKLSKASYDPHRGSLRTYLAILTRSRALDRLRSRRSRAHSLERLKHHSPVTSSHLPTDHLFASEQSAAVEAALAQISETQREVLRLIYYEGLTQAAIAARLDIPLGTVKARARRGLLKLRDILQADQP